MLQSVVKWAVIGLYKNGFQCWQLCLQLLILYGLPKVCENSFDTKTDDFPGFPIYSVSGFLSR